ncbi:hypothetical protein BJ875DRAFT_453236 [Amylocarpus encephaloides]|uniref:Myb-like domain-containing protein n=1 Tax=Amylocarpus encephaloides TaxID=45428 RepID=A0A9P7YPH0_9HELO|nr:hypothetical protein BJ875DRAFT_453236 [Amylocarpus encephaloides]
MLLPSALTCDSSQPSTPKTRFQSRMHFASPPLSPPPSSSSNSSAPALNQLFSTCRALQSMLQPSPIPSQLPSPPSQHAEAPALSLASAPFKLRLRGRGKDANDSTQGLTPRKKITKRAAQPPRGLNKRRRELDDGMSRASFERQESNAQPSTDSEDEWEAHHTMDEERPSTPKRQRLAPEVLPLGLERGDFHTLHLQQLQSSDNALEDVEKPGDEWSTEEDRILVELVLEKLKLSKSDWQDCARSLGKDRGSVGRRWKSLMGNGDVGLKNRGRRSKLHGTWR